LLLSVLLAGPLAACGTSPTTATPSPGPSVVPVPIPSPTPSATLPISGAYRLSIGVDPTCASQLPTDFLTRNYDVDVEPSGDHSQISFLSSDVTPLSSNAPEGSGSVDSGKFRVDFAFLDAHSSAYALAVTAGAADLPLPAPGTPAISGPLFADLRYMDPSRSGDCASTADSFSLSPR
jgi:hypothetical protein